MKTSALDHTNRAKELEQVIDALQGELEDQLTAIEDLQAQVKELKDEDAHHQIIKENQDKEMKWLAKLLMQLSDACESTDRQLTEVSNALILTNQSVQKVQLRAASFGSAKYLVPLSGGACTIIPHLNLKRNHQRRTERQLTMTSPARLELKDVAPGHTRVGWIGTGKAEGLCKDGAVFLKSPKAVAEQSDVVFTIVGYPSDVEEVILGDNGITKGLKPGGVVVDMTTSDPALAQKIFAAAKERSCHAVDAPVM
ncbi:hypothetical protein L7F22_015678 [Adiantum nelumboides]|nr:hypothetical protein [Adiantum nelumboides]